MSKRQSKMDLHIGLYHLECKCSVDCGVALEAVFRASCNLNMLRRLRHRDSTRKIVEVVEYSELGCPKVSHSFGTPWMARLRFPFQSEKMKKIASHRTSSLAKYLAPGKKEIGTTSQAWKPRQGELVFRTTPVVWEPIHGKPFIRNPSYDSRGVGEHEKRRERQCMGRTKHQVGPPIGLLSGLERSA